jgi:hypothetical protein
MANNLYLHTVPQASLQAMPGLVYNGTVPIAIPIAIPVAIPAK